jgi:predicted dienelactone hydrolase
MDTVISLKPVILDDLRVRVSAPADGQDLPVVLFSHGFGSSLEGYGPLTDYWAARGFAVIQPTHLDSRTLTLAADDARTPRIWQHRVEDMKHILDHLDVLEDRLGKRFDRNRIAAAGHSFGGQTTGLLLGLRVEGHEDMSDSRIKAGVLLATAGKGGDDLTPFAAAHFPFLHPSFEHMSKPALVVAGDRDQSVLTTRGPDWSTDPYFLSPGSKSLLTLFEAEHSLGGIPGYEAKETTDENPARVALLQRLTWAYLRNTLDIEAESWAAAQKDLAGLGRLESR